MNPTGPTDGLAVPDPSVPDRGTEPAAPVQNSIRSTQMSQLLHEDLARAHLQARLQQAERQRLADYVVRVARARRQAGRAQRRLQHAQLRLRRLNG
jgi:hypothetical protein